MSAKLSSIAARGLAIVALLAAASALHAQPQPPVHYPYRADQPPGTLALSQLQRGGPLQGYFQPVELYCPEGGRVSFEVEGQFPESRSSRLRAGLLIGPVYRAQVTDIPKHPGAEVYPTIEVINRLYPPPGHEARFPIPVHITQEELELALAGHFVTRVVYLEDPATALPVRDDPKFQRYFEVHPRQDPLYVADELGRPMAVLRMGSRVPDASGQSGQAGMNYGCPPLILYELPEDLPESLPHDAAPHDAAPHDAAPLPGGAATPTSRAAAHMPLVGEQAALEASKSVLVSSARRNEFNASAAQQPIARRPTGGIPVFMRSLFRPRLPGEK
jgi:hypothetical protein